MGYGLEGLGSIPGEILFLHSVQTGCGAYLASYPMGTGCFFPGGKVEEA
jgi:hypothetical protein